jgi:uncharacterized protein YcbX
MRLASIHTYPVKSCRRLDHDAAAVEPWGLAGDRRWMVVDPAGKGLTQRQEPALALIRPTPAPDGLTLVAPGLADLAVPVPDAAPVPVWVHRNELTAVPAGRTADDWLSALLGREVRLVHLHDPTQRPLKPGRGRPEDRVSLADGYPVLLANAASLDAVNDWLVEGGDEPVPMARFRPNLVVTGAPAWAEDDWEWRELRIGAVRFLAGLPCDRCALTTIDQETAERGRQPLRVLGQRRSSPAGPLFGRNLIPLDGGAVEVGAEVTVVG